jgi:hypothetical protein
MKKQTDKTVGISCSGFIALQNGKLIASAKSFNRLVNKEIIINLLGNRSLLIKHVVPKGTIRIY